jgi:hypothetical protein
MATKEYTGFDSLVKAAALLVGFVGFTAALRTLKQSESNDTKLLKEINRKLTLLISPSATSGIEYDDL